MGIKNGVISLELSKILMHKSTTLITKENEERNDSIFMYNIRIFQKTLHELLTKISNLQHQ